MKNLFLFALALFFCGTLFAQNNFEDEEAIKLVIQTAYVEGLQNEGDLDKIDAGIHPGFNLLGISENDEMVALSIEEWKQKTEKKKKEGQFPRKGDRKVAVNFLTIDITGTAAVAKIEFFVGTEKKYVDYICLYKFESGWKMVNKIYYQF